MRLRRAGALSRLIRWLPLAGVVALLGAAMLAAVYANPSIPVLPPQPPPAGGSPSPGPPTAEIIPGETPPSARAAGRGEELPAWLINMLSALCAVSILLIFVSMGWLFLRDQLSVLRGRLRREGSAAPTPQETRRQVSEAIDAGLADLDETDADPRRAVIACWVRLERAAAAAGTPRKVGDTSTELVARLLGAHEVSGDVLAGFAAVYRLARFAPHTVDEAMREHARTALQRVRDELMARR